MELAIHLQKQVEALRAEVKDLEKAREEARQVVKILIDKYVDRIYLPLDIKTRARRVIAGEQ